MFPQRSVLQLRALVVNVLVLQFCGRSKRFLSVVIPDYGK